MSLINGNEIFVPRPLGEVGAALERFFASELGYLSGTPRRVDITRERIKYVLHLSLSSEMPWEIELRAIGAETEVTFWEMEHSRLYDYEAEGGLVAMEWALLNEGQKRFIEHLAADLPELLHLPKIQPTPNSEAIQDAQKIPSSFTHCRYGGQRVWLHCPRCRHRVFRLFLYPRYYLGETRLNHFWCRLCMCGGLSYELRNTKDLVQH